jgi:hypothetical protein
MNRCIFAAVLMLAICSATQYSVAQDSASMALFESQIKHKFLIDFLNTRESQDATTKTDLQINPVYITESKWKPKDAIESFIFGARYNLYIFKPFLTNDEMYLLTWNGPALGIIYLFDSDKNENMLLDSIDLDMRNEARIEKFTLNAYPFLQLRQTVHGTGYRDEREDVIAIINKRFHILFSTSLFAVNDWTMPRGRATGDFVCRRSQIKYVDVNSDGFLDIRKEVNEDIIHMDKCKKDFREARVKKHLKSWVEVYIWSEKTFTFTLDKQKSSDGFD